MEQKINWSNTPKRILRKWFAACKVFLKIMIPVSIVIRLLEEFNLMQYVGAVLAPLMQPLGLEGEIGLVWATTMLSNMYGGLLALSSLGIEGGMTVAQITTLASLMLFAHTFLIEIPICVKAGCRFVPIFLIRFLGAYVFAFLTAQTCSLFGLGTEKITVIEFAQSADTWTAWAMGEAKKYVTIVLVVLLLVVVLEVLEKIGFLKLLERVLAPLVGFIGISPQVIPITIIGMTLGLAYGGGLIVAESKENAISKRDIFLSLAFLSLFHSIIEDHLLMIGLGANAFFVFVLRGGFSVVAMLGIKYLYDRFDKMKKAKSKPV